MKCNIILITWVLPCHNSSFALLQVNHTTEQSKHEMQHEMKMDNKKEFASLKAPPESAIDKPPFISPGSQEALPSTVGSWAHRPIFILAGKDVLVHGIKPNESCPIGVPFEFETPLFKGKALIRIRDLETSDDPTSDCEYFHGRKRLSQCIVQGRFKKELKISDVFCGREYEKPLKQKPPPFVNRIIQTFLRRVAPGVEIDLCSDNPKVLAPLAGSVQGLRADTGGGGPDILTIDDIEDHGFDMYAKRRKKKFSDPRHASKHVFDTKTVYTFNSFDDSINYVDYEMNLKIMKFDMTHVLNGQPFQFMAKSKSVGGYLWLFNMCNERLLEGDA